MSTKNQFTVLVTIIVMSMVYQKSSCDNLQNFLDSSEHCTSLGGGHPSKIIKQYGRTLAKNTDLVLRRIQEAKWEGTDKWESICPVAQKPRKKKERPVAAMMVLLQYLQLLNQIEERKQGSLFFSKCRRNDTYVLIQAVKSTACSLLYGVRELVAHDMEVDFKLDTTVVNNIDVIDAFTMIKTISECVSKTGNIKRIHKCTEPVFKGCRRKRHRSGRKGRKGRKDRQNRKMLSKLTVHS